MVKGIKVVDLGVLINLRATCDLRFSQLGGVESFLEQKFDLPLGESPSHPSMSPYQN
jgi:hypothetical protein